MELNEFILAWASLLIDFLKLVGLDRIAGEIENKFVMPIAE